MADQKKFLDAEGVKYLWSKLSLQDYPNNQTLMDVIEAIDETKADKTELPPATDEAHKVLTTNANGEVVWDDKLCYSHREEYQVHEGFTVPGGKGGAMLIRTPIISPIVEGETYIVNWDGQDIVCVAHNDENSQMGIILGNRYLFEEEFEDTGEPFAICGWFDYNIMSIVQLADTEEHICGGVKGIKTFYTPIDGHYIAGGVYPGSGAASTVIGAGKATGTGSVSVNAGESYGSQTFAEGFGTVHENSTWGHAEGGYTNVFGAMGHAEGYGTTSYGEAQHVQGRTNIPDEECKYAHIVGNGHTYGNFGDKSNAHTLDWEGNAWYQGDVYVGSTSGVNKDEGSVKLARVDELPSKVSELENDSKFITETDVEDLYKKLNANTLLGFYCVEDVTVVVNDVSTIYPANSNVEIKLANDDVFEIIPTSDNSIYALTAFPGALGTFYPWLEGIMQFSNILFDMNDVNMYSKWSQGNQGAYHVQFAQYANCIFWSDNPYVSEVSKRTNYTLYYTSQLPLCYSTIPENTFKSFYLAFNVNTDPNWGNKAYRDSFAAATWATQVFSYYGARTIGVFGHDDPDFNIVLPKDCRGLMYQSTAIENAGTFDAINTTNFGAKSGSWRDAFGQCSSLRNLYIKNLKTNLNISWSPINYKSISFIIENAANENAITISVSPYTYNLLDTSDFELAASKNITIALISTNYVEDKRLSAISTKADKSYVDERVTALVNSAPETLDTLGELAAALQANDEVVQVLNDAIVTKADKTYVDEAIANIPTESDMLVIDCPDGSVISHTFDQIMTAINSGKAVYASIYGSIMAPLTYIADDNSFIEFKLVNMDQSIITIDSLKINNDNSFTVNQSSSQALATEEFVNNKVAKLSNTDWNDLKNNLSQSIDNPWYYPIDAAKIEIYYQDSLFCTFVRTNLVSMRGTSYWKYSGGCNNISIRNTLYGESFDFNDEENQAKVFFSTNFDRAYYDADGNRMMDVENNLIAKKNQSVTWLFGHLADMDENHVWNVINYFPITCNDCGKDNVALAMDMAHKYIAGLSNEPTGQSLRLTDTVTGIEYMIAITNGKLTMQEV